ncbi:hypothetical protein JCM8097_004033 [Rhodosporidiobolus ruineniae]
MLLSLPVELVERILRLALPEEVTPRTYGQRQSSLRSVCLVSSALRRLAQPILEEVAYIRSSASLLRYSTQCTTEPANPISFDVSLTHIAELSFVSWPPPSDPLITPVTFPSVRILASERGAASAALYKQLDAFVCCGYWDPQTWTQDHLPPARTLQPVLYPFDLYPEVVTFKFPCELCIDEKELVAGPERLQDFAARVLELPSPAIHLPVFCLPTFTKDYTSSATSDTAPHSALKVFCESCAACKIRVEWEDFKDEEGIPLTSHKFWQYAREVRAKEEVPAEPAEVV